MSRPLVIPMMVFLLISALCRGACVDAEPRASACGRYHCLASTPASAAMPSADSSALSEACRQRPPASARQTPAFRWSEQHSGDGEEYPGAEVRGPEGIGLDHRNQGREDL